MVFPDPLSATASIVGIVVPTLHALRLLKADITNIKGASKTANNLNNDLSTLEDTLAPLNEAAEDDIVRELGNKVQNGLKKSLLNCQTACTDFQTKLSRWTKHSTADKMSKRDRFAVGFWNNKDVKQFADVLATSKKTLSDALGSTNLLISIRDKRNTDEILRILESREDEIRNTINVAENQLAQVDNRLQDVGSQDRTDGVDQQDVEDEIRELQHQREAIQYQREIGQEMLSKVHQRRTGQRITNTGATTGGQLNAGMLFVDRDSHDVMQELDNVHASWAGRANVGIVADKIPEGLFNGGSGMPLPPIWLLLIVVVLILAIMLAR